MNIDPSATAAASRPAATQPSGSLTRPGSTAEFRVPHFWGLITVKGRFERLDGRLETAENGQRRMTLTIEAATVRTGYWQRDRHLRGAAFFDADNHPEVIFRSSSVSDLGDGRLRVEGELRAAGRQLALTLEPTVHETGDTLEIDVTTTVDQRLLGMTWSPLGMTRSPAIAHRPRQAAARRITVAHPAVCRAQADVRIAARVPVDRWWRPGVRLAARRWARPARSRVDRAGERARASSPVGADPHRGRWRAARAAFASGHIRSRTAVSYAHGSRAISTDLIDKVRSATQDRVVAHRPSGVGSVPGPAISREPFASPGPSASEGEIMSATIDPTFYRSAREAAEAPREQLAYVATFDRCRRRCRTRCR